MANKFSDDRWRSDVEPRNGAASAPQARKVRITQQFRELRNMTYELDCCGVPLVLRVFFPKDTSDPQWRIEASAGSSVPASLASASATSKAQALQQIAQNWREAMPPPASNLDWNGIAQAMTAVRGI